MAEGGVARIETAESGGNGTVEGGGGRNGGAAAGAVALQWPAAAALASTDDDACVLEASEANLRRALRAVGLLKQNGGTLPPQLAADPLGDRMRQVARELHNLTRHNTLRCAVLRQRAQAAATLEQGQRLAAAAAARVKRRNARIRKAARAKKAGGGAAKS
jgi:hypothetical protein